MDTVEKNEGKEKIQEGKINSTNQNSSFILVSIHMVIQNLKNTEKHWSKISNTSFIGIA